MTPPHRACARPQALAGARPFSRKRRARLGRLPRRNPCRKQPPVTDAITGGQWTRSKRWCWPIRAGSTRRSSCAGCRTTYGCEVVTFTADLGQGEELEPARAQGRDDGREGDLHRGPARGVRPRLRLPDVPRQRALRGHLPARHLDRPAADRQAPDRDRRARSAPTRSPTAPPARATTRSASSSPTMRSTPTSSVIAPWREWDLSSRTKLIEYAETHQIPIPRGKRGEAPYSTDANQRTARRWSRPSTTLPCRRTWSRWR